jgi:hypothetical protein
MVQCVIVHLVYDIMQLDHTSRSGAPAEILAAAATISICPLSFPDRPAGVVRQSMRIVR